MQKICPSCREVNPAEAAFCRSCATPLGAVAPQAPQWGQQQQAPPQWGQQQPGFGNQPFGGPMQAPMSQPMQQSNRPLIALILVIAGLLCCGFLTSIPGAILGWMEMNAIKEGRAPQSGMTMSQIAFYGGIVVSILNLIGTVIAVIVMLSGNM